MTGGLLITGVIALAFAAPGIAIGNLVRPERSAQPVQPSRVPMTTERARRAKRCVVALSIAVAVWLLVVLAAILWGTP